MKNIENRKICLPTILRQTSRSAAMAIAVLLIACQTGRAALPNFPANSIAPLYGKWESAVGKGRVVINIGAKWITSMDDRCPQRTRYEVMSIGTKTLEGEQSLDIILRIVDASFIGKKAQNNCPIRMLSGDAYMNIYLIDLGNAPDAPIGTFGWQTCDTLKHLKEPYDPGHPNVRSCGAGGGIMNRLRQRHR